MTLRNFLSVLIFLASRSEAMGTIDWGDVDCDTRLAKSWGEQTMKALSGGTVYYHMVQGSKPLKAFLDRYKSLLGSVVLECGPYSNPLVVPAVHSGTHIFYWDVDVSALEELVKLPVARNTLVTAQHVDFRKLEKPEDAARFEGRVHRAYQKAGLGMKASFNSIVISSVLNYVDFQNFLSFVSRFQRPGDHIFIGNVIDWGIHDEMHPRRPFLNEDIPRVLKTLGYEIVEQDTTPRWFQPHNNFRLVARKIQNIESPIARP
jgi:hypothetical protein